MSDTPETDAAERMAYSQEYMVPTEFSRKLERERDEAREALRTLAEHGENEIQKLIKECDEARNKMADALQEVDLRTLDFERMKQERDEARELCRELTDLVAYGLGQSGEPWSLDVMRKATELIRKN
jgi:hypothetical protein